MSNVTAMTKAKAKALTQRIRDGVESIVTLLRQAYDEGAWKALGYETWEAYVKTEFAMSRSRSYQILDQGRVIEEVKSAAGLSTMVDIDERQARAIKGDLPAVTAEIRSRVDLGETPEQVAADVVAKAAARKAEREARGRQQAENDRQREAARAALPDAIKRGEEAKAKNGSKDAAVTGLSPAERIAELEEANKALEADNAAMKRRLAMFDETAVLFEKGGIEAVIAAKDEQIRVLKTRVETESADKAAWKRKADYRLAELKKLGWSTKLVIPVDA